MIQSSEAESVGGHHLAIRPTVTSGQQPHSMADFRLEKDSLGEVKVPADALYGAQTQRAVENFPVSGIRFPRVLIRALGLIKATAAEVNAGLGLLDATIAHAIHLAGLEVADGRWDDHFPL